MHADGGLQVRIPDPVLRAMPCNFSGMRVHLNTRAESMELTFIARCTLPRLQPRALATSSSVTGSPDGLVNSLRTCSTLHGALL